MKAKDALLNSMLQKGITNRQVIEAMRQLPRELFISAQYQNQAYEDIPLPIAAGQTISQPYIIAQMTQVLLEQGTVKKVLEIGTGSGYQAAILSLLVDEVYTVERIEALFKEATKRLHDLKLNNIHTFYRDGYDGLPEYGPFDAIIVTAAAKKIPNELLIQLREGGRLVIPVGSEQDQQLKVIDKKGDRYITQNIEAVRFVPMLQGKTK